jgi:glutaredoxin
MKLYVCHGTFLTAPRPGGHPCGQAYKALREAGYDPEVEKVRGWDKLPDAIANRTPGRRKVKELTGSVTVPVLVMDDGTAMPESRDIIAWAKANPASA